MKRIALGILLVAQICFVDAAVAKPPIARLDLKVNGITNGNMIPNKFAYCIPNDNGHSKYGDNISPSISWFGGPKETKSFALIIVDRDAPEKFDMVDQPERAIPASFPRTDYYHWVLINIPPEVKGLFEGKNSHGITQGGKPPSITEYGINGVNGYGGGGYDGPCPPWNDEQLHHYHFIVYALDVPSLQLPDNVNNALFINGKVAESAMVGHILAQGEVVGTYTTNEEVLKAVTKAATASKIGNRR